MITSKTICALDMCWNDRHLSHYFLIVPDLPHDIYIGSDIMIRLNAYMDTVNEVIWAPLSRQLTTLVNLKNLRSGQTMPEVCAMTNEQGATVPAYTKSVSILLNIRPGQNLNHNRGFFQLLQNCLKLGQTLEASHLMEVSSRAVYVLFNNCMANEIKIPKASHLGRLISQTFHDLELTVPVIGPISAQLLPEESVDHRVFTAPLKTIAITSILSVPQENVCRAELTDNAQQLKTTLILHIHSPHSSRRINNNSCGRRHKTRP